MISPRVVNSQRDEPGSHSQVPDVIDGSSKNTWLRVRISPVNGSADGCPSGFSARSEDGMSAARNEMVTGRV